MNPIQPDLSFDEETHTYRWRGSVCIGVTSLFDRVGTRQDDKHPWNPIGCPDFCKTEHDSNFGSASHKVFEIIMKGGTPKYPESMQPWVDSFNRFIEKYPVKPLYDQNGNPIVEYPVYSVKHKYAGTIDCVCKCERDYTPEEIMAIWKSSDKSKIDKDLIKFIETLRPWERKKIILTAVRGKTHKTVIKKALYPGNPILLIDWKTSSSYQKSYSLQTAAYEQAFREVFEGVIFPRKSKIVRMTVLINEDEYKPYPRDQKTGSGDFNTFLSILNTYRFAA